VANLLRRLAPNLRAVGVEVTFGRQAGTGRRIIGISKDPGFIVTAVTAVTPPARQASQVSLL
jgi:hypothetical protein